MNTVLIACGDFTTVSGAPMFAYDLGKELHRRGKQVIIAAPNVGGVMAEKAREYGATCLTFDQTRGQKPDVLHVNGLPASHWAVHAFPGVPAVATVHSQLIYETPYVHDAIKHYACVRPEIMSKVVGQDGVPWHKTSVVFNGVDMERFAPNDDKFDPPTILFAGTVDYLRAQASHKMFDIAAEKGWEIAFVGRRLSGHLDDLPAHVKYVNGDVWDIQDLTSRCSATAGILLGRTLLEGWACGIPGYVFEIDTEGQVLGWDLFPPPPPQIMAMFNIRYMVDCYERLYEQSH